MTSEIRIAVVNHTDVHDDDVRQAVAALQRQVNEDFGPVWQVGARLEVVPVKNRRTPMPDHWGLVLLDERKLRDDHDTPFSDEDNPVLAYHDLTSHGLPLAKVFVNRVPAGQDWSHWASHELLEMLVDPDVNTAAYGQPGDHGPRFYAREICDPCAGYADGYECAGRRVSDFVFPAWFRHRVTPEHEDDRFDERRRIGGRFQVLPHGYTSVFDAAAAAWRVLDSAGRLHEEADIDTRPGLRARGPGGFSPTGMKWCP